PAASAGADIASGKVATAYAKAAAAAARGMNDIGLSPICGHREMWTGAIADQKPQGLRLRRLGSGRASAARLADQPIMGGKRSGSTSCPDSTGQGSQYATMLYATGS